PIALEEWEEGPALHDIVTVRNEAGADVVIPIRPDAKYTLRDTRIPDGKNRYRYFLEADMGTMSHARMKQKGSGYINYFQQQKHTKKYPGMKSFRVVTVTETKGRAKELIETFRSMMEPAWLPWYPVIPFEELTLQALVPQITPAPH